MVSSVAFGWALLIACDYDRENDRCIAIGNVKGVARRENNGARVRWHSSVFERYCSEAHRSKLRGLEGAVLVHVDRIEGLLQEVVRHHLYIH